MAPHVLPRAWYVGLGTILSFPAISLDDSATLHALHDKITLENGATLHALHSEIAS